VVDTLVVTRELKGIGVEVFFIEDNIWTMDGDGELRLSLMATLAQEESRKVSERVRAGQQISRSNHSLYGNGNILGYNRAGDTYVINETQAETVRMIFDLYLHGEGSLKICKHLTELHRETATGLVKWSPPTVVRIISNGTYTGRVCYNKSRSNNFLEQHRVLNLDRSTYEYAEGNFPPIISLETWERAQQLMQAKRKPVAMKSGKITHSNRSSKDLWVNKLRCSCGAACRKDKWHTRKDGTITYGYQCYNRLNNGSKQQREKLGLDTDGFCGIHMYGEWKLEYMARELLKHLFFDENEVVLTALDLIKKYYREDGSPEKGQAAALQSRLSKANARLSRLIEMRADDEISKDEYKIMRAPVDAEIAEIKKAMESEDTAEQPHPDTLDIEQLETVLRKMATLSPDAINLDLIDSLVYRVTPTSDTRFEWYLHLSGNAGAKAAFCIDGKKSDCSISLEEITAISSLHSFSVMNKNDIAEKSPLSALLYRLPSRTPASNCAGLTL